MIYKCDTFGKNQSNLKMPDFPAKKISVFGKTYLLTRDDSAHAISVNNSMSNLTCNAGEIMIGFGKGETGDLVNLFSDGARAGIVSGRGDTGLIKMGESLPEEVERVYAFMGTPVLHIQTQNSKATFISALLQDAQEICRNEEINADNPVGFTAELTQTLVEGSVVTHKGNRVLMDSAEVEKLQMAGLFFTVPEHINRENQMLRSMSGQLIKFPFGGGVSAVCFGMFTDAASNPSIRFIEPETQFLQAEMKLFRLFEE